MKKPPSSGPITVVTPNTAPSAPWYRPRSRSGMTSPISAIAVTMIAPPPMPCSARDGTSMVIDPASPHSTEPARKNTTAAWKTSLAAEQVAELADDRGGDRRGQQIAGHHPGLVAGTAEVGDHGRQRGGHDGLVERGQQHAEQHRNEDEVAALRS